MTDDGSEPKRRVGYKTPPAREIGKKAAQAKVVACSKASSATRHKVFAERYLVNGNNATEAAKFSGYSERTAHAQGYRLLQMESVKTILGNRAESLLRAAELTTERWAKEMAAIGHFDPGELYDADGNLIPIYKLPEHVRRAIGTVKIERRFEGRGEDRTEVVTQEVRPCDKNTALANIGKHLGMFEQDNRQKAQNIRVLVQLVG